MAAADAPDAVAAPALEAAAVAAPALEAAAAVAADSAAAGAVLRLRERLCVLWRLRRLRRLWLGRLLLVMGRVRVLLTGLPSVYVYTQGRESRI